MSDTILPDADTFLGLVNQSFMLDVNGESLQLQLAEVDQSRMDPARGRPYSLLFHGPADSTLKQSIYSLVDGNDKSLELFLVPLGPEGDVMTYEAIIN